MSSQSAVQVVSVERDAVEGPSFGVLEENLNSVLLQNHAKDLPVVILSIAGTYREGKSFFLNLVGEYLRNEGRDNWLNSGNISLDCFHWMGGVEGVTSGLWLCPDPFVVTGPNGEKIAVLLMDSQGTFDTATSMGESAGVFALSALLSNVQIYNMKEKFSSENLDALKLFVDYGSAARGRDDNKLFKALQFLLRDWSDDQYPYGADGGRQFLQQQREIQQRNNNTTLGEIAGGFESVDCFLLPFPWNNLQTRKNREASLTDLSADFKTQITKLLSTMLTWDNLKQLVKKDMTGSNITTGEILVYIKKYVEKFNGDELTSPKSALEANIEISLTKISAMSLSVFDEAVAGELGADGPARPADWLAALLDSARRGALDFFEAKVTAITSEPLKAACRAKLEQDICVRKLQVENYNSAKESQEELSQLKEEAESVRIETESILAEIERERREEKKEIEKVKADAEKAKRDMEIEIDTIKKKNLEVLKGKNTKIYELEEQRAEVELKNKKEIEDIVKKNGEEIAKRDREYQENLEIKREESESKIKEVKITSEKDAREHFEKEIRKVKEEMEEQARKKKQEADDRMQKLKASQEKQDKKILGLQRQMKAAAKANPAAQPAKTYWPSEETCSSEEDVSSWPDRENYQQCEPAMPYWPYGENCQPEILCWPAEQNCQPCQPTIPYCPIEQNCQTEIQYCPIEQNCQTEIQYRPIEENCQPCEPAITCWPVEENCQPCQSYWYAE